MPRFTGGGGGSSSSEGSDSDSDFLRPSRTEDDYEFADQNRGKRRKTGRNTKESAALGVFGSESEDEGPGRRWKRKEGMRKRGVAFVTAGDRGNGEDDGDEDELEAEDDMEEEGEGEEEPSRPRFGLGLGAASFAQQGNEDVDMDREEEPRMGVGFGVSETADINAPGFTPKMWQSSGGIRGGPVPAVDASPFGTGFTPSSAFAPVLRTDLKDKPATPRAAMPSAFSTPTSSVGARNKGSQKAATINAGSFAARMMAKMGYKEGQGLGKEGQGRSGVIEVQLRPQGVGLGAVREKSVQEKEEEKRQAAIRGETLEDSDEEKKRRIRTRARLNGSTGGSSLSTPKRKPKPKYQSLTEIRSAAPGLDVPEAFRPILDMTGPGHKLLTSASGILTPTTGVSAPETTESIEARKLARNAQNDLTSFVEEWKNLGERKAWVDLEIVQQLQLVDEQDVTVNQLQLVAHAVQGLSVAVQGGQWDPVLIALTSIDELGIDDNSELENIAVAAIAPFFRQAVEGWQPLEDPKLSGVAAGFAPALLSIRHLLGMSYKSTGSALETRHNNNSADSHHFRARKATAFESLLYTTWFPKVRSAITNAWDVHDPTRLQTLLEIWEPLTPAFIRSEILDQLVVRKLDEAIDVWNPRKARRHSSQLPHMWLFPWLQYLGAHHADPKSSSGLVSDIKRKFRHLIDAWDFSRGVVPGLTQWKTVLRPAAGSDTWTPLIINHVLPNLGRYLRQNFRVQPQDQQPYMACFNDVLTWETIIDTKMMAQLIVDDFFPLWLDVLHTWLTSPDANYMEIDEWISWWTSVIPATIQATPIIQAEWKRGRDLVNAALDLGPAARASLPLPTKPIKHRSSDPSTSVASHTTATDGPQEQTKKSVPDPISFRHAVEDWALENELQFLPQKSMLDAKGPVYRVTASPIGKGGVLVYFGGEHVFAQVKKDAWRDLGSGIDALDVLMDLAYRV